MSIELIENEIRRFLSAAEPEVICISGRWGVGKTYAWNHYLGDALAAKTLALSHYAYVSLFGVNSLDELKFSIFENSASVFEIRMAPDMQTVESSTKVAAAKKMGKKAIGAAKQLPGVKSYIGDLGPMLGFSLVKNTIVCVDDIERRGNNLAIRDVLGLVSNLREHKGCKVVLILNDEALEKDKLEFDRYFEKVIDSSLKFAPTAKECAEIGLAQDTATGKMLSEFCVALGVSNIRLIKKIERAARQIEPMLQSFDEEVFKRAARWITLFGWSIYDTDRAPSLEYLKGKQAALFGARKKDALSEKEASWNALLDAYGFSMMDEFGLALVDGMRNGYFDPLLVEQHASEIDKTIKLSKQGSSFESAWRPFHDSFGDNQEEVLDGIYASFIKNVQSIPALSVSGTVGIFKELGRAGQAAELLAYYIEQHADNRRLFDLDNNPFRDRIDDPDVIQAFKAKVATFEIVVDPVAVLQSMADRNGWHPDDLDVLSKLPVESYYDIFKKFQGDELRKLLNACLQFDRIENASEAMREISRRAREALRRIGEESPLNAQRVRKYGINISDSVPPGHENPERAS
jgi:hypothetical protein